MNAAVAPRGACDRSAAEAPARPSGFLAEYVADAPRMLALTHSASLFPIACYETSDIEVLVAGTIVDSPAFAARLALPATASPAQVVHEAYRQHGEQCLDLVVGRAAILIADRRSRRLLAVRDRMGVFPLFHARSRRGVLLSSSTADLRRHPDVSRNLNRLVLAEHLVNRWIDARETYFSAVWRVPSGHVLDVRDRGETLRRYWDPGADGADDPTTDEEAIERFNEALRQAVARCVGSGRAGILLSGGFDSVSIGAIATMLARESGGRTPYALSIKFPDPECDEEVVQRGVARTLGLSHDLLPLGETLGGRSLLDAALELGRGWSTPMLNLWSPAYLEMARRGVREGCDVVLSGTGGDEWLNVTPCIAADLLRAGEVGQLARFMVVFQRSFRLSKPQLVRNMLWTFGARRLLGTAISRIAGRTWHASRHRREIARTPLWVASDPALRRQMDERVARLIPAADPGVGGFYDRELQMALAHPLVATEYEEHFEFGLRTGVPLLSPYLDSDLVGLLYRMPPTMLTAGGRSKGLVRSAVSRLFPDLGFERHKKVNANTFFRNVVANEGPEQWQRWNGARTLIDMGVLHGPQAARKATEVFAGRDPKNSYLIWDMLNINAWVSSNGAALLSGSET